jgi:hypothetical protein
MTQKKEILTTGWREWVSLPKLGITTIKAKIDTGARTSALHAFALRPFRDGTQDKICFDIHPLQYNTDLVITCTADIIDQRLVTDSGGHREMRYVIRTPLSLGGRLWPIEITLTERDSMQFRMLLGRRALRKRFIIDPSQSFILSGPRDKNLIEGHS